MSCGERTAISVHCLSVFSHCLFLLFPLPFIVFPLLCSASKRCIVLHRQFGQATLSTAKLPEVLVLLANPEQARRRGLVVMMEQSEEAAAVAEIEAAARPMEQFGVRPT